MTSADATIASRLAASLPKTRWFADKAVPIAEVDVRERASLAQDAAELAIADVHLAGHDPSSPSSRYVVILDTDGGDASAAPDVARRLLELVLSGGAISGRRGRFVGHPTGHGKRVSSHAPTGPVTVTPLGGDASNTSLLVRCGSIGWVIKLFRRCRAGIQPEVEIGEFFATASPWPDTPRLCGWLEYVPADGEHDAETTAIASVHEFAPGHATGWDRLVALLSADDRPTGRFSDEVLAIVAALGGVTARMHRAFSARQDLPAFAPEPAMPAGRRAAAERMRQHAEGVFASIESRLPHVGRTVADRLASVLKARPALVHRFDDLENLGLGTSDIRVHGDYHLGQLLVAEQWNKLLVAEQWNKLLVAEQWNKLLVAEQCNKLLVAEQGGVLVIDFEGEPGRTLAERRDKTAAAKDVAGMCRSFDYLLRHVAKSTGRPHAAADLDRLESHYLDAYREGAAGQPWWPADDDAADALLAVFKLDKAIYELAYELNNRPDWIDVPLAAIEDVVRTKG